MKLLRTLYIISLVSMSYVIPWAHAEEPTGPSMSSDPAAVRPGGGGSGAPAGGTPGSGTVAPKAAEPIPTQKLFQDYVQSEKFKKQNAYVKTLVTLGVPETDPNTKAVIPFEKQIQAREQAIQYAAQRADAYLADPNQKEEQYTGALASGDAVAKLSNKKALADLHTQLKASVAAELPLYQFDETAIDTLKKGGKVDDPEAAVPAGDASVPTADAQSPHRSPVESKATPQTDLSRLAAKRLKGLVPDAINVIKEAVSGPSGKGSDTPIADDSKAPTSDKEDTQPQQQPPQPYPPPYAGGPQGGGGGQPSAGGDKTKPVEGSKMNAAQVASPGDSPTSLADSVSQGLSGSPGEGFGSLQERFGRKPVEAADPADGAEKGSTAAALTAPSYNVPSFMRNFASNVASYLPNNLANRLGYNSSGDGQTVINGKGTLGEKIAESAGPGAESPPAAAPTGNRGVKGPGGGSQDGGGGDNILDPERGPDPSPKYDMAKLVAQLGGEGSNGGDAEKKEGEDEEKKEGLASTKERDQTMADYLIRLGKQTVASIYSRGAPGPWGLHTGLVQSVCLDMPDLLKACSRVRRPEEAPEKGSSYTQKAIAGNRSLASRAMADGLIQRASVKTIR